jgi:hypothetical protein
LLGILAFAATVESQSVLTSQNVEGNFACGCRYICFYFIHWVRRFVIFDHRSSDHRDFPEHGNPSSQQLSAIFRTSHEFDEHYGHLAGEWYDWWKRHIRDNLYVRPLHSAKLGTIHRHHSDGNLAGRYDEDRECHCDGD